MAEHALQPNTFPRVSAPERLDADTLRFLRRREAERCVVFADWAALQPEEAAYDDAAFDALRERLMTVTSLGSEPVLCLYRGEDPAWFAARGGWQKEDNLRCYLRYVGKVVRAVGHLCGEYITLYEPNALIWHSGARPSFAKAVTTLSHMACTHIRAVRLIRDTRQQRQLTGTAVGIAMRLYPAAELRLDFLRGRLPVTAALYERLPLLAMAKGEFHAPLRNTLRVQPGVWADFIGVTGAEEPAKRSLCCVRAQELTGIEPRIMEE